MTAARQNVRDVAVEGCLEPRVLGYTDELEEEDGLEEADEADVKEETHAAIVPDFGVCVGNGPDSELILV